MLYSLNGREIRMKVLEPGYKVGRWPHDDTFSPGALFLRAIFQRNDCQDLQVDNRMENNWLQWQQLFQRRRAGFYLDLSVTSTTVTKNQIKRKFGDFPGSYLPQEKIGHILSYSFNRVRDWPEE